MADRVYDFDGIEVKIKADEDAKVFLCSVKGNLETSNSPKFLNLVENELSRNSYKKMILELADLLYISSTGIGTFTTLLISCKNRGTELILRNMQPKVKSVFDLLGFSSFFKMEQES